MKTSFQKLVAQCKPFVGKSSPMTDREIDIVKSAEYAKGAQREREEILRIIWDAVETAPSAPQEEMARTLFYRIERK